MNQGLEPFAARAQVMEGQVFGQTGREGRDQGDQHKDKRAEPAREAPDPVRGRPPTGPGSVGGQGVCLRLIAPA